MTDENTQSSNEDISNEGLLKELQEQTREARRLLSLLKPLTNNGEITKELFETLKDLIQKSLSGIRSAKSLNTKTANELAKQVDKVDEYLDDARTASGNFKVLLKDIEALKLKIERRKDAIENIKEEVMDKKKTITASKRVIDKLFKLSEKLSEQATKNIEDIKSNKTLSDSILKLLKDVNKQAEQNNKDLKAYYVKGKKSFARIEDTAKQVKSLFTDTENKNTAIVQWFNKLFDKNGIQETIERVTKKIRAQQEEIDRQLGEAASNRLCKSFKQKLDELKIELKNWKRWIIGMVLSIFVLNLSITLNVDLNYIKFASISGIQQIELLSPFVFLLVFASLEYAKTKRFLEEYNFKYIAAHALPAYFELIEERDEQAALKYLIETTNTIYQNVADKIMGQNRSKDNILDYVVEVFKSFLSKNKVTSEKVLSELITSTVKDAIEKYPHEQTSIKKEGDNSDLVPEVSEYRSSSIDESS